MVQIDKTRLCRTNANSYNKSQTGSSMISVFIKEMVFIHDHFFQGILEVFVYVDLSGDTGHQRP